MSDNIAVGAPVFGITLIIPGDVFFTCVWCGKLLVGGAGFQDAISGGAWPVCMECSDRGDQDGERY